MANTGKCPKCNQDNDYSSVFCSFCGERLPWADAVIGAKAKATDDANEQARLAARVNAGLDKSGLTRDKAVEATKGFLNSPEFKESAAKEVQWWGKSFAIFLGCFGVCVVLLILFVMIAMLSS